jgi:pimeloyl-ACP methyl ester carboxylesterase
MAGENRPFLFPGYAFHCHCATSCIQFWVEFQYRISLKGFCMFLDIEGHKMWAVDIGAGPRTILAHSGWTGTFEDWIDIMGLMSPRWRAVAYDHRGAGESAFPPETISTEALVDDVFRVMDKMKIDRCVIGGFSRGTWIVLQAVLRDPSRFDGLILMNGAGGVQRPDAPPTQRIGLAKFPGETYRDKLRWFMERCTPEPDVEHVRRLGVNVLQRATPEAAQALGDIKLPETDWVGRLSELKIPTLLIHGEKDFAIDEASMRYAQSLIPNSKLVILEGSGHVPSITRPKDIHAAIVEFFE